MSERARLGSGIRASRAASARFGRLRTSRGPPPRSPEQPTDRPHRIPDRRRAPRRTSARASARSRRRSGQRITPHHTRIVRPRIRAPDTARWRTHPDAHSPSRMARGSNGTTSVAGQAVRLPRRRTTSRPSIGGDGGGQGEDATGYVDRIIRCPGRAAARGQRHSRDSVVDERPCAPVRRGAIGPRRPSGAIARHPRGRRRRACSIGPIPKGDKDRRGWRPPLTLVSAELEEVGRIHQGRMFPQVLHRLSQPAASDA